MNNLINRHQINEVDHYGNSIKRLKVVRNFKKQESPAVTDKPAKACQSEGTPSNTNEIYTSMTFTFSGLQFRHWYYLSIFIRLAVVASQNGEIRRNSDNN